MKKLFCVAITLCLLKLNYLNGQDVYSSLRNYTVSIGYVDSVVVNPSLMKKEKRFILVGSGLVTYNKLDTNIIFSIVTAKHVIKFFEESKIDSFRIRFSWADTIVISKYYGIGIPLYPSKDVKSFFYHKNSDIDLGCILLPNNINDEVAEKYYVEGNRKPVIFPYNKILNPKVGDNVLIYGYPGHIENYFENLSFIVCTFKPGIVTWGSNQTKTFLDNVLLVESNASYGNSGGPVFSLNNGFSGNGGFTVGADPSLIGILVAGTTEPNEVKLNGKTLLDPASKKPYYTENRSGVSIVIKAELVKDLLAQVNEIINSKKNY